MQYVTPPAYPPSSAGTVWEVGHGKVAETLTAETEPGFEL